MSDQSENLDAIDRYIKSTPLLTAAARDLRDEWTRWYDDQGWYGRNYDIEVYDHARNLRNRFHLANAITTEQRRIAERMIQTGMTSEEMAGGTTRAMSSGMYDEPLIASTTKAKLILGATVAGAGWIAWKLGHLNPLLKKVGL